MIHWLATRERRRDSSAHGKSVRGLAQFTSARPDQPEGLVARSSNQLAALAEAARLARTKPASRTTAAAE
jgi:hypothetical protein